MTIVYCNVLLPRVPNRITETCSQTLNLRHWKIFFLLSICYPLKKMGNACIDAWSRIAVIIWRKGYFNYDLKCNVGAFIHVGSWYKIKGQFLLKKILTTFIISNVKLLCTFVMHTCRCCQIYASAKWSRLPEKYHKPRLLQTDWQITKNEDAWKLVGLFL